MAAVMADEARVRPYVERRQAEVSIAAVNGPANVVISGRSEAVAEVAAELSAAGVKTRPLNVSHAFHSPLMDAVLDEFEAVAATVTFAPPRIKVISNLTGAAATAPDLMSPRYWREHLRGAVRFADGVQALVGGGCNVFVETGPHPTAIGMAMQGAGAGECLFVPSLKQNQEDWRTLLDGVSQVYVRGVAIDWQAFDRGYDVRRVTLDTYPFQRERYWAEPRPKAAFSPGPDPAALHPLLGRRLSSPALTDVVFEGRLGRATHGYLYDHQVHGTPILPATGFLELAMAAGREIGRGAPRVADLAIHEAMVLPESGTLAVQVVIGALAGEADQRAHGGRGGRGDGEARVPVTTGSARASEPGAPRPYGSTRRACRRSRRGGTSRSHR
jgi:acyl transferase domain-containing protein